jgi:pyruvate carboxylase subunit B
MSTLKRIEVMDTSFRDGFQSVFGARVLTPDFLPAIHAAVDAGIKHFEVGGGARFQSLFFYCNENAFDMMDTVRKTVGNDINLQSLSRGINVVGLDSQPSDIIELHAKLFKKHGMTTVRNFDALNDPENLVFSSACIKKYGLKHEVAITLMDLPPGCTGAHDVTFYQKVLEKILDKGIPFDSLCFKDASGTAHPQKVLETIQMARKILPKGTFVRFHTHESAGVSVACYLAALEGGADGIDLAMCPVSGGTSQPDILTMIHALKETNFDLGLDEKKILLVEEVFKTCMKDYFFPSEALSVSPLIPFSPMPGGALTANTQMMRDNGMLDRFPDVIKAMEECVRKGGFGTSVTPVSQFYFQQALNNVMFGPWKKIAEGYGKMVLGYFGHTPVPPDPTIVEISSQQLNLLPTTSSPLDRDNRNPKKGIQSAKQKLIENNLPETEENIFIVANCEDKGIQFLKGEGKIQIIRKEKSSSVILPIVDQHYTIVIDNQSYEASVQQNKVMINNKEYPIQIQKSDKPTLIPVSNQGALDIKAPMAGVVLAIHQKKGARVSKDDLLFVLEAMKMEIEVRSPFSGIIADVQAQVGDKVNTGQKMITIQKQVKE